MESKIVEQLMSDLASENQEITYVIESQEQFMNYLTTKLKETNGNKDIKEIIDNFKKIMI